MKKVLFLLCAVCALRLSGQNTADLEKKLDDKISSSLAKSGAPSVSVAVVRDGKLFYAKAFGSADLASKRPAAVETTYAVGSITKQFTAAAVLLLQEQGKLSLDDPVARFFPNLTRAKEITILQLLSHTSGYEDYAPQDYIIPDWTRPISAEAVVNRWAGKPLNFDPGTKWQYSNTNYVLAGLIVEKAAGQSWTSFLREKIFAPLGMQSAAAWPPVRSSDAVAYTRYSVGPPRPCSREAASWYFAAGNLAMTPSDLAKWDIAFLNKRILSAKSYDEFTREVKLHNGDSTHYALGLSLHEIGNVPAFEHSGEVSGFLSSNSVFPTRDGAVVVLSNEDGVGLVSSLAKEIATLLFLPEPIVPPDSATASVQKVLSGLQAGSIDRALFTANANSYFSDEALRDFKESLGKLGKLTKVTPVAESLRGGMIHRTYTAEFEEKKLRLNLYLLPDGKFEQFMVEDPI